MNQDDVLVSSNGYLVDPIIDISKYIKDGYMVENIALYAGTTLCLVMEQEETKNVVIFIKQLTLYMPEPSFKRKVGGVYFEFDNVRTVAPKEVNIVQDYYSDSTVDAIKTLWKMYYLLLKIKESKIEFVCLDKKISLIEDLLMNMTSDLQTSYKFSTEDLDEFPSLLKQSSVEIIKRTVPLLNRFYK